MWRMKLTSLTGADATCAGDGLRHRSPQGGARAPCVRRVPAARAVNGEDFVSAMRWRAERDGGRGAGRRRGWKVCRTSTADAHGAARDASPVLAAAVFRSHCPRDAGRGDRHERQNVDRRADAPVVDAWRGTAPPRSGRSAYHGRGRPAQCDRADDARCGDVFIEPRTVSRARGWNAHLAFEASSHGLTPAPHRGVSPSRRRRSPTSAVITSIITVTMEAYLDGQADRLFSRRCWRPTTRRRWCGRTMPVAGQVIAAGEARSGDRAGLHGGSPLRATTWRLIERLHRRRCWGRDVDASHVGADERVITYNCR